MLEVKLSNKNVTIRKPKVRDLVLLDSVDGEVQKEILLISTLSQLPEDEILDMDLPDYGKLQEKVQGFLA